MIDEDECYNCVEIEEIVIMSKDAPPHGIDMSQEDIERNRWAKDEGQCRHAAAAAILACVGITTPEFSQEEIDKQVFRTGSPFGSSDLGSIGPGRGITEEKLSSREKISIDGYDVYIRRDKEPTDSQPGYYDMYVASKADPSVGFMHYTFWPRSADSYRSQLESFRNIAAYAQKRREEQQK
jgi:hypothetical protein